MIMIKFLNKIFGKKEEAQSEPISSDMDLAVIVILLRAAAIDGDKDKIELDAIEKIAINDLNLDPQDFKGLYQKALEEEDISADLYKWTKIINDNSDEESIARNNAEIYAITQYLYPDGDKVKNNNSSK